MLTRYDTAPINKIEQDANTGFIHVNNVPIARVGVFPYLKADGSIEMEAKLPAELLADTTVKSADNKPVTDDHPEEFVNQSNAKKYMKGFTASNAHVDNDTLRVDMTITDADLINEINQGKQELSIGFETEIVPQKGEYKGSVYDSVQKNIQINHVAVVERGRAGHSVRLVGDSAEMVDEDIKKGNQMETTKVRLGDSDITVAISDADKLIKLDADNSEKEKKIADLKAKIADYKKQLDELQGDADSSKKNEEEAKAEKDALEKQLEKYKKKYEGDGLDQAIDSKINLIEQVKPYVGDSFDFKGKTDKDIKVATLKAIDDSIDLSDKSDDYINAYFDSTIKNQSNPRVVGYQGSDSEFKNDSDELNTLRMARYNLRNKGDK